MDIVKIQSLITQGKVIDLTSTNPDETYLQVGVYQTPTSRRSSSDANAYAPYVIPLSALIEASKVGIYAQTASSTPITNTTAELSLLDGGVGTLTVPANGFQVGDSFQANLSGHINSKNNDSIRIRVKTAAGALLADTNAVVMPNCTNQHWDLKINFTIRALGPAGTAAIASTAMFTYTKNASNAFEGENVSVINQTTFDTTINNTLVITAEWDAADPLNSIYTELFTLFKTY